MDDRYMIENDPSDQVFGIELPEGYRRTRFPRKWRRMPPAVLRVRRRLPQSWFTKRGPGVEREMQLALRTLTREERRLAVARGWVHPSFLVAGGLL